jgi:hypothetical protein
MRRLLIAFALLALSIGGASAQSILDLLNLQHVITSNWVLEQTITGTDGTACQIIKVPNSTIYAWFSCVNGTTLLKSAQIMATGTAAQSNAFIAGQVACVIAANPTAAAVTEGSLGSVPAGGIAWQCANGDGKTLIPSIPGTVTWP